MPSQANFSGQCFLGENINGNWVKWGGMIGFDVMFQQCCAPPHPAGHASGVNNAVPQRGCQH